MGWGRRCRPLLTAPLAAVATLPSWEVRADGAYKNCPCATSGGSGYGWGHCRAWDNATSFGHQACLLVDRPEWCSKYWCYVEANNCSRSYFPSERLGEQFFYSYTTCGNVGGFDSVLARRPEHIKNVRAGIYGTLGPRATLDADHGLPNLDLALRFAVNVLADMGINAESLNYQNLSKGAVQANPLSAYSACAYDIALGNLDVCLGDFWATDERLQWGVPFVNVYEENIVLVVPSVSVRENLLQIFGKPFLPFSSELWGAIFAVIIASSTLMAYFEHGAGDFNQNRRASAVISKWKRLRTFGEIFYKSLTSFFAGEICFFPSTISGRMLGFGLSVFVCLCLSTFTANTASSMIASAQVKIAENIEELLNAGKTICYHGSSRHRLKLIHPRIINYGVPLTSSGTGRPLEALERGICDACLTSEPILFRDRAQGASCRFKVAGRAIFNYPTGYFVAPHLAQQMTYSAAKKRFDGTWYRYEQMLYPPSSCREESDAGGFQQLQVSHMLGVFCFMAICALLAICMKIEFWGYVKLQAALEDDRRMASISRSLGVHHDRQPPTSQDGSLRESADEFQDETPKSGRCTSECEIAAFSEEFQDEIQDEAPKSGLTARQLKL